jgi:hypothetical protein
VKKKLLDFIKNDTELFIISLVVIALVIVLGLPIIIWFARLLWTMALAPIPI